jgi:hypothetical protein
MSQRQRGVVRMWNAKRGFGFITPDIGETDFLLNLVSDIPTDDAVAGGAYRDFRAADAVAR